ncbi:hypothetical protein GQ54DRAFT_192190 [Martensiomyces pterosporus]|nr:hypothetical protein GQ54DRAFT_192190 [Martensiomyces pterosporus]
MLRRTRYEQYPSSWTRLSNSASTKRQTLSRRIHQTPATDATTIWTNFLPVTTSSSLITCRTLPLWYLRHPRAPPLLIPELTLLITIHLLSSYYLVAPHCFLFPPQSCLGASRTPLRSTSALFQSLCPKTRMSRSSTSDHG